MLDPQLSGLQLQELAGQRPDLWPEILAHPNCYPELAQWIQASWAAQAQSTNQPQPVESVNLVQPETPQPEPVQPQPEFVQPQPEMQPAQPQPEVQPVAQQPQPVQPQPAQPQPEFTQPQTQFQPAQPAHPQISISGKTGAKASKRKKSKGLTIALTTLTVLVVAALVGVGILYVPGWLKGSSRGQALSIERFIKKPKFVSANLPADLGKVKTIIPGEEADTVIGSKAIYKWDGKELKKDEAKINPSAPGGYVKGLPAKFASPSLSGGDKYPWFKITPKDNGPKDKSKKDKDQPPVVKTGPNGKDSKGREYGGGNDKHFCTFNNQEAVCGSPEDLENGKGKSAGKKEESEPGDIEMDIIGAFAVDDGTVVIKKTTNKKYNDTEIELRGKDQKTKVFSGQPGVFTNIYEYVGYASDWKTRMVPTPTTGLTINKIEDLLKSSAGEVKIVNGIVLNQTRYASQNWTDGKVTFKGMLEPIQLDKKYLLATYGQPATAEKPQPKAEGIVVFGRDGKELARHAFAVPSRVFTDQGKVFTVPLDEKQPPKLFEYGVGEGKEMPAGKPPKENTDKNAIKKLDFGNFKSKELGEDGKEPAWNFSGGKYVINREDLEPIVIHIFNSDAFYQDLDGDGFMDAILPAAYCFSPDYCSALAYVFLWDTGSNEPVVYDVLGNVRAKYTTGDVESTRRAAIDLIHKKNGKAAFCLAALENLNGECHTFKILQGKGMYFDESNTAVYTWDADQFQRVRAVSKDAYTLKALPYDDAPTPKVNFEKLFIVEGQPESSRGYVMMMGVKAGTDCAYNAETRGLGCGYMVWGKKK